MRTITVLTAAALLVAPAGAQTMVGEEALDFSLEALDGGLVSLSHFSGQVVLLNFFGYN